MGAPLTEADLKRALIASLRSQGGNGFRIEDKYRIGVPDLLMVPTKSPGFLLEAKLLRGDKLVCTPTQAVYIRRFQQPPHFFAAVIGYSEKMEALYIGLPDTSLKQCRFVPRPHSLDGSQWDISELLGKWKHDTCRALDVA